jgi:predicted transcriptional regulator of viral defense system
MASLNVQPTMGEVLAVADRQHGLVTLPQLVRLGLTRAAVKHRLRRGRLHRIRPGVYAVGSPRITLQAQWLAAVLACGPGAALSHATAAALYGIRPARPGKVHVSVARGRRPRQAGVEVHRRERLAVTAHAQIPVTVIALTLVDIAAGSTRAELERAINEADKLDLIDPEALRTRIEDYMGLPGAARLRDTLDRRTLALTDSELERAFLPIATRAGLPPPQTGAWVNDF